MGYSLDLRAKSRITRGNHAPHPERRLPMQQPSKPETRIQELHLTLPTPAKPVAKYKMTVQVGNLLYVSGHAPAKVGDKAPPPVKVGDDLSLEQGKEAARGVGLNILS